VDADERIGGGEAEPGILVGEDHHRGVAGVDLAVLESALPDEVGLDELGKGDALRRFGVGALRPARSRPIA